MPSVSKKQHNLMAMVANNPAKAKKLGIPQSVGEEFMKADKGRKFREDSRASSQGINKPKTDHGKMALFNKGGEMAESKKMAKKEIAFMEKKGAPKSMIKHEKEEYGMKKGGKAKMAMGGRISPRMQQMSRENDMDVPRAPTPVIMPPARNERELPPYRGPVPGRSSGMGMKKGGSVMEKKGMTTAKMGKVVSGGKKAHGEHTIQQKGHTKGKMVAMAKGGKAYGGKC